MKLARAAVILDAMERGELVATTEELDALVERGLVADLDPSLLQTLDQMISLGSDYGGVAFREPQTRWSHGWIVTALEALEEKLQSDFHRLVTSDEKLAEEEQERVALRGLLGALRDPDRLRELQQAAHTRDSVVAPSARMVRRTSELWSVYAITRHGRELVTVLRIRGADSTQELEGFLKAFRRSDTAMTQFAGAIHYLDQSVQGVRKGKQHVVAGLAKSGLPPAQAVAAFQQARASWRGSGLPVEQPHFAVTCVRQLQTGVQLSRAQQRLALAQDAVNRAGFGATPQARGAAKALLAFPDLDAAAARLRELSGHVRTAGAYTYGVASRLLSAEGSPREVAERWHAAVQALSHQGVRSQPDLAIGAATIAAQAKSSAEVTELVIKCAQIAKAAVACGLCLYGAAWATALSLAAYPGSPEEAVATALHLASRISGGAPPSPQTVELACTFAKRFAIKAPPGRTVPSPRAARAG